MSDAGEETLWHSRLADFREATASAQPTPGGGSVAGVSAALGVGLLIMALEISVKRKDAVLPENARELIAEARRLMALLSAGADGDILAFRGYMTALQLPKATDAEKALRREKLQSATRQATESPLQTARHILDALRLAGKAVPLTHTHVVSDVAAGASLLEGALKAVLFNVDINLPSLADAGLRAAWGEERAGLARHSAEVAAEVLRAISARLAA